MRLYQIQEEIRRRAADIASAHGNRPCRKGCDDCCRQLAAPPRVSHEEWLLISRALNALPAGLAETARRRIRESSGAARPVVCPLLDPDSGTCLVYDSRPLACRAYGFYVERHNVLGCTRIESVSRQSLDIIWGNHAALEERAQSLGPALELSEWLDVGSNSHKLSQSGWRKT
jgi:Fe-S-cluster containining protein